MADNLPELCIIGQNTFQYFIFHLDTIRYSSALGSNITLDCYGEVNWGFHDGLLPPNTKRETQSTSLIDISLLHITNVVKGNSGTYSCYGQKIYNVILSGIQTGL